MISISLFLVVVVFGMNALLNANVVHQKSQDMRSILDNLSFILEDMGELDSATILLGGLLASGEITDSREIHFLTQRLEEMKIAGKSSSMSKN